jgi:hypothetical protein
MIHPSLIEAQRLYREAMRPPERKPFAAAGFDSRDGDFRASMIMRNASARGRRIMAADLRLPQDLTDAELQAASISASQQLESSWTNRARFGMKSSAARARRPKSFRWKHVAKKAAIADRPIVLLMTAP